jgi:hypothetical protein
MHVHSEYFPASCNSGPEQETTPVVTAIITTIPVIQTIPTEPIHTQASDTEFLLALDISEAKILDLLGGINTELAKASVSNGTSGLQRTWELQSQTIRNR